MLPAGYFAGQFGNIPGYGNAASIWQRTSDEEHGRDSENTFDSRTIVINAEPMNGIQLGYDNKPNGEFHSFNPDGTANGVSPFLIPTNDRHFAPLVFSRSNPSRPYVDTGVFVGELKDLPSMMKSVWDSARDIYRYAKRGRSIGEALRLSFIGGAKETFPNADKRFLESSFGWVPFVSDIQKYMNVANVVEKRYHELQKLRSTGQSSRRVPLDDARDVSTGSTVISSVTGRLFEGRKTTIQAYARWGVGKWTIDAGGRLSQANTIEKITSLARDSVMGLTVDSSTAWNLMPWSWLIDWASNTGDWIESSRNIVGASKSSASIMTTNTGLIKVQRDVAADGQRLVEGGSYNIQLRDKSRTIHNSFLLPEMTVEILSSRQSAILGALMTSRLRR